MKPEDAAKEALSLRNEINRHNHLYYVAAAPEISDREYDELYRRLEDLEARFPELADENSPTRRVGGEPLDDFNNVRHRLPMMSLSNTYSKDELVQFDKRIRDLLITPGYTYVLEPKIDGVAISLVYENGRLTAGITRGDGTTGDDITANIRTIRSIPLTLATDSPPPLLEVRGEIYMTRDGFSALNEQRTESGLAPFANPRNAAAGSLKLLDSKQVAERPLDAVIYASGATEGIDFATHDDLLLKLSELGFRTSPEHWSCSDIESVIKHIDELDSKRHDFQFEIDGGVIKVNERSLYETLGSTAKSPRWAVAYKYEPERAETVINSITIQVGRTGVLTPVAELEPVPLAGTVVKRATLHNEEEIARKDIREGDRVLIEKAGEIIPAVIKVLKDFRPDDSEPFHMPDNCPCCGGPVIKKEGEAALRCDNLQCQAQIKSWIRHFATRGAMDIDGLGESLIEQLVDAGLVKSPADLYRLKAYEVVQLDRMAAKSATNLIEGIKKSRERDLWRLLFGLGIRHVGARSAQTLEEHFKSIDELAASELEKLEQIPDIGPVVAASITGFFRSEANMEIITSLRESGVNMDRLSEPETGEQPLSGKTFVLTGTLSTMTRGQAGEIIKKLGGKTSSSVSAKTSYVVAGEKAGSKLAKAEKLGVDILTEEQFIELTSSPAADM